jgi:hypothetical protein
MRYFEDSRFTTGLARAWHLGPSASESIERDIFELSLLFVNRSALFVLARCPLPTKFPRGFVGAFSRTIAPICAWRGNRKMYSASEAVSAFFGSSFMFVAANASSALRT